MTASCQRRCDVTTTAPGANSARASGDDILRFYINNYKNLFGLLAWRSRRPVGNVLPERLVAVPLDKCWRRPVWPAVGGKGHGSSLTKIPAGKQRIIADLGHGYRLGQTCQPAVAENLRPDVEQTSDQGMIGRTYRRGDPRRSLDPIIEGEDQHRQRIFDRRSGIATLAFDTLEGQIAADHDQPAPGGDPVAQQRQPVRCGERTLKSIRR